MNKVAIITGARRGIGKTTAFRFAKEGFDVVVVDKEDKKAIEEVAECIEKEYSVKAVSAFLDISKEDKVFELLDNVKGIFGRVDVLVNNAAIVYDVELDDRTEAMFNETLINNVSSAYLMSKHFGKFMFENNEIGKIINISSTNGTDAYFPTSLDYDASKAAIISLTHNFACAYAPKILVNAVAPHWVNTEMNADLPPELVKEETDKILLGRFAEPEEISELIYFLASEKNTYINGEIITISGGR